MADRKRAFVSGGSRGIGFSIAKNFLLEGVDVIIVSRNENSLAKGLRSLEKICIEKKLVSSVSGYAINLADFSAVQTLMRELNSIDIVVNNAGIVKDKFLMRMRYADWQDVIDINLTSVYNVCHSVIPAMCKQRFGRIINISSVVGIRGNPCQTNYAAAKAGMIGFTKALAKEVAARNITVNCVAPGFTETDMISHLDKEKIINMIPLRRLGMAEDIAHMVLFLAGSRASYITGQTMVVDGGIGI